MFFFMSTSLLAAMTECHRHYDRTTMIYGTVKDEHQKPLEGITLVASGERGMLGSIGGSK